MSDARAKELIDLGSAMFNGRGGLMSYLQEVAENFYPERAEFTAEKGIANGLDTGDNFDSTPNLFRRELGNSVSAWLRPRNSPWFRCITDGEDREPDAASAQYLEYITTTLRRALYDTRAKFVRATKEGDHDFITFGQAVIAVEEAASREHLYFRSHHIRDCAWLDNDLGEIDHMHRKDMLTARVMRLKFGEAALHRTIKSACEKEPSKRFPIRCVVMPADEYDMIEASRGDKSKRKLPFVVIYLDVDNCKILREGGLPDFPYVVPRWHTISGSPYAFSPATTIALADARLMQSMARIILEAGEKAIDPPMIATEEAIRQINTQAGGISWADYAYDERLGEALRPIPMGGDMRTAFAMRADLREMLSKSFFLDKLTLPESGVKEMTAFEVQRRMEEFTRAVLPLFEPMEVEYNSRLLDKSFALLRNMDKFDLAAMPDRLSGANITYQFESPIQQAERRGLVAKFGEAMGLISAAAQVGVDVVPIHLDKALKDALEGVGGPATWRKTDDEMADEADARAQARDDEAASREVAETAGLVTEASRAAEALDQAMVPAREKITAGRRPAAQAAPAARPAAMTMQRPKARAA